MIRKIFRVKKQIRQSDLIRIMCSLCCLIPASSLYAIDDADKSEVSLSTMLRFNDSTMWTDLGTKTQENLAIDLEQEWVKRGLPDNKQSICVDEECTPLAASDYLLEITVAGVSRGQLTQGLSISIEQSDPRKAHIHEQIVLPITCTLRDTENATMINLNQWNAPVPQGMQSGQQTDSHHLARLLVEACRDTVFKSGIQYAGMKPDNQSEFSTPFPEVTLEKRTIPAKAKVSDQTSSSGEDVVTAIDSNEQQNATASQVNITKDQSSDERTQYIIKNPASEVIIEFGQSR